MKKIGLLVILLLLTLPVSAQTTDALLLYSVLGDGTGTVLVVNVDTGEVTQIAELDMSGGYGGWDVGWSPDGSYVWVVDNPNQFRRLRVFEAGTWSERLIIEELFLSSCDSNAYWSPDGQKLSYFVGDDPDQQLALLNLSDNVTHMYEDVLSPEVGGRPFWSPDGRYIVIEDRLVDASDGSVVPEFDGFFSEFSPDGRFLVYRDPTIWLYNLATSKSIDLVITETSDDWSPDGRYLLIRLSDEEAENPFQFYDLQSLQFKPLSVEERIWDIAGWLQGGAEALAVTYSNDDGSDQTLLRYTIASGEVTPILETPGFIGRVITDGSWLVVTYGVSEERGYQPTTHVWMSDGERVLDEELVIHGNISTNAAEVAWSPDGRWLMLLAEDGIYRFDPQTAALERLPVEGSRFEVPLWSADGRYLVFHAFAHDESQSRQTMVWNTVDDTIEPLPYLVGTIIGWQNGDTQDSLLYCGIGG